VQREKPICYAKRLRFIRKTIKFAERETGKKEELGRIVG